MIRCLALALALSAPSADAPVPIPDVVPPGHHGVRHELVLSWEALVDPDAVRFVAHPVRGFSGVTEIEPGVPFAFSSKYGTQIYAAPRAAELPADREGFAAQGWPSAPAPVAEISSVPMADPVARVETAVEIVAVRPDGIEFSRLGERRFDAAGNELDGSGTWLLLGIAAVGALLLGGLVRGGLIRGRSAATHRRGQPAASTATRQPPPDSETA